LCLGKGLSVWEKQKVISRDGALRKGKGKIGIGREYDNKSGGVKMAVLPLNAERIVNTQQDPVSLTGKRAIGGGERLAPSRLGGSAPLGKRKRVLIKMQGRTRILAPVTPSHNNFRGEREIKNVEEKKKRERYKASWVMGAWRKKRSGGVVGWCINTNRRGKKGISKTRRLTKTKHKKREKKERKKVPPQ